MCLIKKILKKSETQVNPHKSQQKNLFNTIIVTCKIIKITALILNRFHRKFQKKFEMYIQF